MEQWLVFSGCLIVFLLMRELMKGKQRISDGDGKTAILTGAAGGIGKAAVLKLVRNGWKVICCDIDSGRLDGAKKEIATIANESSVNDKIIIKHLDISSKVSRDEFYQFISEYCKSYSLDAIISVAGVMQAQPQATLDEQQLSSIFEINALGPMKLMNTLIPYLLKNESGGTITLVTSLNARVTWLNIGSYPATKHALAGWGDTLRREAKQNALPLRVSMIEPGSVVTPIAMNLITRQLQWCERSKDSKWVKGIYKSASSALKFMSRGMKIEWLSITPEDVADLILVSVSVKNPNARYVRAAFPLLVIFYLVLFMPTHLGDLLLGSL